MWTLLIGLAAAAHPPFPATADPTVTAAIAELDRLSAEQVYANDKKDAALFERKPKEVEAFRDGLRAAAEATADPEVRAALGVLRAEASLYYADLGYSVRPPTGMRKADEALYNDLLAEKWYPTFDPILAQGRAELGQVPAGTAWGAYAATRAAELEPAKRAKRGRRAR